MAQAQNDKPVALVTGGSRGIGLGICEKLAAEGFNLAVCGRRAAGDVPGGLAVLKEAGSEVQYVQADIGVPTDRTRLLTVVRDRFGRLDVLVNNAGMAPRVRADILDAAEDVYEEVMKVNLQGPYFLTQAAARWMREQGKEGRKRTKIEPQDQRSEERSRQSFSIIFITSISSTVASPSRGEYCISKAGLSMAAQLWAVRLAEYGIAVNEVRPGIIATDMTSGVKEKYDKMIKEGLNLQPRWGTPEDVGKAVASLVRGDWGFSTGGAIYVDGGMTVRRL